jgi:hypothetical protein
LPAAGGERCCGVAAVGEIELGQRLGLLPDPRPARPRSRQPLACRAAIV